VVEVLYYYANWSLRSEREFIDDVYYFHDTFVHPDAKLNDAGTDISEGIFDGDWSMSAVDAMQRKYDTYFRYLQLEPGMRLLDYGCGNCQWLVYCRDRGVEVEGITLSSDQVALCRSKGIVTHAGDYRLIVTELPDSSFDAITSIGSTEHLVTLSTPNELVKPIFFEFCKHLKRILKPSGRVLNTIMLINLSSPVWHNGGSRRLLPTVTDKDGDLMDWSPHLIAIMHVYLIGSFFTGYYPSYGCSTESAVDQCIDELCRSLKR
jgi:cyclopropane fatty-acyl-phospholipid synthase-like methyltransferase